MIIDETLNPWIIKWAYDETHINHYGQFPVGIRFHLGIIDNHDELKEVYNSSEEKITDKLMLATTTIKEIRDVEKIGAFLYENNEAFDYENCFPYMQKALKNDHWEYLRTDTWWGKRCREVFSFHVHTYCPEHNHTKVLFWNWVYQEYVLKTRIKKQNPSSTINGDDTVQNITFSYGGMNRNFSIVTSTKNKYRNHTEALKNAKIFIKPKELVPRVLYK